MDAQKMGAFIAQCRKEKQMTQEQLAQRLQVTDKAVSRWERGVGFPDITTIEPLAQALGVEVLELMHAQRLKKPDNSNSKTEQAVHDILQLAQEQRRQERKKIALLLAGVLTALLLLLVLDVLDWQWEAILFTGLGGLSSRCFVPVERRCCCCMAFTERHEENLSGFALQRR